MAVASVATLVAAAAISFGRTGGSIVPYRVDVASTGVVTASGPVQAVQRVPPRAVSGLLTLAGALRFSSLPGRIQCPHVMPDVASLYVTIRGRTVTSHGACNRRFNELYAVVKAVAGVAG